MILLQTIAVAAVWALAAVCWRHVYLLHWSGRRELRLVRREVPAPDAPESAALLAVADWIEAGGMGRTRRGARLP